MDKEKAKDFFLDIIFPKFCLGCKREGSFLCDDCLATIDINRAGQRRPSPHLSWLYFSTEYRNPLIKEMISRFKYEPLVKELAKDISRIIIRHFQLLEEKPGFLKDLSRPREKSSYLLLPVPLAKKRLRWRGFNQSEELAREISPFWGIPLLSGILLKKKETPAQVELSKKERGENIRGAFEVENAEMIFGKKVLLVDDVYTTGATMDECARVLKESGAREVTGIVAARALPGQDYSSGAF